MPRMSQRAYSRHRGCALSTVQAALKNGRITADPKTGLIDSAKADRAWSEKTDQTRTFRPADQGANGRGRRPAGDGSVSEDFMRARTARETYAARMAELEFERRSGLLLPSDEFEKAGFTAGRRFHDALINLGDRIGPVVVGLEVHEAIKLINREAARILDDMALGPSKNGKGRD